MKKSISIKRKNNRTTTANKTLRLMPAVLLAGVLTSVCSMSYAAASNPAGSDFNSMATQSFIIANNKIMLNLFSQKNTNLAQDPANTNHKFYTPFSPSALYSQQTSSSSAGVLQQMFSNFHSNYSKQDSGMRPSVSAEDVTSDSIIAPDSSSKLSYQDGMVQMTSISSANSKDQNFNLADLVATDRINPVITDNDGKPVTNPTLLALSINMKPTSDLENLVHNNCDTLAQSLTNPSQDFGGGLDTAKLTSIAQDPDKTQKLLQDAWGKPKDSGDSSKLLGGKAGGGSSTAGMGASMPFGKPYWSNYLNSLHQVYAAKTMGYATIYQLCLERSPTRLPGQALGTPVESPMQHTADTVNQINNPQYLKTIQSQSVNANLKELIKVQRQTLQMLFQLHKDSESMNANIASSGIINASNYGSSIAQMGAMNINREISSIAGSGSK